MPILDLLLVIVLGALIGLFVRRVKENAQSQQRLDDAFYRLLEAQESRIALIQLAAAARVDVERAKQYLEQQVRLFAAIPEVDADGDTFYRFPKLHERSVNGSDA
jgi:hypothetical protein